MFIFLIFYYFTIIIFILYLLYLFHLFDIEIVEIQFFIVMMCLIYMLIYSYFYQLRLKIDCYCILEEKFQFVMSFR
jgi:hypothetical protein